MAPASLPALAEPIQPANVGMVTLRAGSLRSPPRGDSIQILALPPSGYDRETSYTRPSLSFPT